MLDERASPSARAARAAAIGALANELFDVVVIGGGITGAGIAREAALAQQRVALLERDDFASGTSSRSSRLVHGGVRYLEHGHLALVFESSRERRFLLSLAPHLVRPLAFTWPVYRGARVPRWKLRAGLSLYDALSMFRNTQRHHALSAREIETAEPALSREDLLGGARYWDAATDDTRLTLANALAARESGAVVLNHVTVTGGLRANGDTRLLGVRVHDVVGNVDFDVRARVVINATGPWSDATASLTGASTMQSVLGSAGAHIAIPRHRLGNNDAVTMISPIDGRVTFALPAGPHAIIGTTERVAHVGPEAIRATQFEVQYLLRTTNALFPNAQLTLDDVVAAWAGIRPLAVARAGVGGANAASREHAITRRDDGLISVTGGKLTTYRAMSADVLSRITTPSHESTSAPLPGGDFDSRDRLLHDARETVHDAAVAERLVHAYGSRWRSVWSYAQRDASLKHRLVDDLPYLLAEIPYAIERELACTLSDVLMRRTHVAFETRDNGRSASRRIAPLVATFLGWSERDVEREIAAYHVDASRVFGIDTG